MYKILTLIIGVCLLLTGCDTKPANGIGFGTIEQGVYTNDYFNMSIKVPENWTVRSQAAQQELMDKGTSLISGEDDNLKNVLKESQKQSVNLFSFIKYEQGTPVPFNPSINAIAERVSRMPGIKRGSDYHFHAKKLLESGQMNYEFPRDIYTKDISGISFDVMSAQITVNNITIYQEYYAARVNDYVLLFVLSYSSDSEIDELKSILNDLRLSK